MSVCLSVCLSYTVRKIASYNLYLCRLRRIPCIDTDYNLQIIILIYPANMLCIQLKGWIDTEHYMYQYSIFSVSIQKVLLSSFYGQILDLMFSRLTFVSMIFIWAYIDLKSFSYFPQRKCFNSWIDTLIAWVFYSYVNKLFMTNKSLGTWKLLLTDSKVKMF